MKKSTLLFAYLAMLGLPVLASETEGAEDEKPASPLKLSGYVDTYYLYNFNKTRSNLGASGFERIFDQNANSFQVGLAQMKGTYTTSRMEGVIDFVFGNHADLANYGNAGSPLGYQMGSSSLAIKQAYIAYKITDKLSVTAGQYGTHIGYEVIDAPLNFNYSLSNLFGNGPFYHTGVKLSYDFSEKLGVMVGLTNGLDTKEDFNNKKGVQAQVFMQPNENWSLYLNYFGTDEGIDSKNKTEWYDLASSYQLTKSFSAGLNATYGRNNIGGWKGSALYLKNEFSDKVSVGARLEYFDNLKGGIYLVDTEGGGVATTEVTLTASFNLTSNLMFKTEYRFDHYSHGNNKETYQLSNPDGIFNKNAQSTLGGALIFHF